jgi:leucine dehydrogenase
MGGRYITAEDVGMTEADMTAIARRTPYVTGLPSDDPGSAGGNPGPITAKGVYLGIRAGVKHKLGRKDMDGVHVAIQGVGSVGGGVARLLAADGARLTLADLDEARAAALAAELGADQVSADAIMDVECDVLSPNALGAILDDASIARLRTSVVAGGANNQLARPEHGPKLAERGVLFAPDYVINAGGIITVTLEYLARTSGEPCSVGQVHAAVEEIPGRLESIWQEAERSGATADQVADAMAQRLIGR